MHIDVPGGTGTGTGAGAGQSWVDKQEEKGKEQEVGKKAGGELSRLARSFAELPDCMMKLICMVTLLLSDADLAFAYITCTCACICKYTWVTLLLSDADLAFTYITCTCACTCPCTCTYT